ncbi:hypothetical protein [Arcobacter porcinus]|uniref:Uncharacterized protein n=1 Tax=Arcobacter porcinus TaxID=1935204 RepID=A0A1C0AXC9_9BACT|nr:hypothetical protein [Arcobacter porcinus]OCL97289.1 hypothetical protein AAX27_00196 [Aliarcobacter thereius]OCL84189.1 hypothetical protein AAW30_00562 [Arcobacter porcinus]OCL84715.1 hypothetical protein AAW29_00393 [Arcobacter porcinus]OCL89253.1 hypothetical protein AAX30_00390 [Arcobacter porcinus]OCL91673.1 hypothetical protein AAX28_01418 [Arcobacter porcinus]
MKKIILGLGEQLLNVFVILGFIVAIVIILIGLFGGNFIQSLIIGIAILFSVVFTTFLLYLLIDIKDKVSKTNELLSKKDN